LLKASAIERGVFRHAVRTRVSRAVRAHLRVAESSLRVSGRFAEKRPIAQIPIMTTRFVLAEIGDRRRQNASRIAADRKWRQRKIQIENLLGLVRLLDLQRAKTTGREAWRKATAPRSGYPSGRAS